jgi:membrane glycosyltransferase
MHGESNALKDAASRAFLPHERPLSMPEQSLWDRRECNNAPSTASRWVPTGRLMVVIATMVLTGLAANEMYQVLKIAGLTGLETLVLVLFVMLFAWIAFSLVSTIIGFVAVVVRRHSLGIDPNAPLPPLTSRNALLLPTYNEEPHRVMSRLQAIYESVAETGQIEHFDFFVLSDSTDPDVWVLEEAAYLTLARATDARRVFYRHRRKNIGRKSGNIAEWIARFGGRYDHMIVLDADSLMTGDTIIRLAGGMEQNPNVGLIQTLPVLINGRTLFARIQQFAGRVYGPLIAHGIAWWHGSEGNYWGHNAIIRVRAFADQAGLPLLGGPKPFGGHILSHDFVEAALMRRAGWGVHMAPSLGGSFEECPPSLTDYAVRDRRWCQGNIQHLSVLPARGLHWVSRLHLLTGIGSYITSPMWLFFLVAGILISLQAQFIRPEYFSERSLFPTWPAQDPVRAAWVFAGTMGILLVPKILGYIALLPRSRERKGCGGAIRAFLSVILETFISGLIAPVMMLMQSRSIMEIAIGRDSGWSAQRRDDGGLSRAEMIRTYGWPTSLGIIFAAGAYAVSLPLFLWMTPVIVGLVLAVPMVALTSNPRVGEALRSAGFLLTPEERDLPAVLRRANDLAARSPHKERANAVALLADDDALAAAHNAMLNASSRRRRDFDADLLTGLAKIDDADSLEEAIGSLSAKEAFAVLSLRDIVERLRRMPRSGSD